MTITLSLAPTPMTGAIAIGRSGPTASVVDFGGALDAAMENGGQAIRNAVHAASSLDAPPAGDSTALGTEIVNLLDRLTEMLAALEQGPADDLPPDAALLETLEGLMTQLGVLLEEIGIQAPADSPSGLLAARLHQGLGAAALPDAIRETLATKLDTVASLANRLAGELGEDARPRLEGFARLLDRTAAALTLPETRPGPDMLLKLARSETAQDAAVPRPAGNPAPDPAAARPAQGTPSETPRPAAGRDLASAAPLLEDALAAGAGGAEKRAEALPVASAPQIAASTATATTGPAAYVRPEAQVNMPFIAAEIARHIQNGISRFEIRLNPPEMGRIDVRLEFDPSGAITARLAVERSETLDLMMRDQRTLERMLAQTGLDSGKTSLEFSLRQNGGDRGFDENGPEPGASGGAEPAAPVAQAEPAPPRTILYRGYVRADAVNLWI